MVFFNHTIDDSDCILKYSPYADGDFTGGWTPWFSNSGGFRDVSVPGEDGVGQSLHYTAFDGSSVFLEFHGSAIYVFGSANCTYDVTIDSTSVGTDLTSQTNVLFATTGLSRGTHFLNVTAHASTTRQLALDSIVVSDVLPNGVDSLAPVVYDNTNTTLQYAGDWEVDNDNQIPSKSAPKPYHQTSASMASVSLNFTGTAIAINGAPNWGHWTYNVTLDGVSKQYNASTFWLVGNAQLFWESGLDPNEPHQIELINSAGAGMIMTVNDFTVYAPNVSTNTGGTSTTSSLSGTQSSPPATSSVTASTGSASKVNAGVIAGPVVAGVVIIALIVGAFLWTRRRKGPFQDQPAPYYEGYASSSNRLSEKGGQTVLSPPPPSIPYQSEEQPTDAAAFNPYASQAVVVTPTDSRAALSHTSPVSSGQPTSPQLHQQQPVDVDRIIELIAQRIDRPPPAEHEVPPQYPH